MKLLLTSAGVRNPSIEAALTRLLGRPVAECTALCVPTALYGHPWVGPGRNARDFVTGRSDHLTGLGWESVGLLELTALPSIPEERWVPLVQETDALLVAGGDALYLAHWMRLSGLAELLPSLERTVWVGMSAGSMVLTPRIGDDFVGWERPDDGGDTALGVVGFSIFPHLDHPDLPSNTLPAAERWAAGIGGPAYAIDDETAIVVDGPGANAEVVSEGAWHRLG
ncbi:Type 1 glutamine amidotransferase-like domain-containing protein [Promicromonospora citrea]|uniref:Peptidase E n=1 Tax=Promicromonospora citrea TaxID=43677 RepID=A0A8H9GIW3_9MICO|nr:Type 1 glutamine amidotransferase-like domain-containing protein [Promicromonospora citrea]NNH51373.1 type 1 glutamine amidotransferase-like domain-containing protein [Promicromonospora citrea]GGM22820.1 peptidase E [Promicromonospora citrea]